MDRYNRLWRDPKSPLTPLTPIATQVFSFDHGTATPTPTSRNSQRSERRLNLKPSYLSVPGRRHTMTSSTCGKRKSFSQDFMKLRSVFSPNAQSTKTEIDATTPTAPRIIKQEPRHFKRSSPVEQPTLSPRVRTLLGRTGNEHLTELFTRQEIDIQVLIRMTLEDLESLGVRGAKELKLALDVIKLAKSFFK